MDVSPPLGSNAAWSGGLFLGSGVACFLGKAGNASLHRHHAAQLCVALESTHWIREEDDLAWCSFAAAFVPPNVAHAFHGGGAETMLLYVDPAQAACRRLVASLGSTAIVPIDSTGRDLVARRVALARENGGGFREIAATSSRWLNELAGVEPDGHSWREASDGRLRQVLNALDDPGPPAPLAQLAAQAGVSPSRLTHLFTEQIGVPIRRYRLWRRLQIAAIEAAHGANLTVAAHAAGFADSAHLTRTFRSMFGLAPSDLLREVRVAT